jgi:lactate dehydrogenase-like 2-hydroxyacid dehydrogenase
MPLPRIVVVPPTFAEIAKRARTLALSGFELVIVRNEHTELEAALATAEYLVCYPNVRTGDAFYRAAPSLRLHQLLSAGYDDVDLEAARRAKVPISNNGGANAISVAEHAMMLMLMVSRRVISQHANVLGGRWRGNGPAPRMYEIHGKTLGIIGLGTIGACATPRRRPRRAAAVGGAGAVAFGDVISDGAGQSWRYQPVHFVPPYRRRYFVAVQCRSLLHSTLRKCRRPPVTSALG